MAESGEKASGGRPPIFISYASQDSAVANAVVAALERQGLKCWIAPRDVVPGSLYADELVRAISEATVVVLVLSERAIASSNVGKEIERASSKGRRIIALRMDSAPLTRALEYFLSESQWIEVGPGGIETASGKLVAAVRLHVDSGERGQSGPESVVSEGSKSGAEAYSPGPQALTTKSAASRGTRMVTMSALAALVIVVVGLVLIDKFWLSNGAVGQKSSGTASIVSDKSIAVLPFTDLSEKKDQEYFADGMAEEILDLLARIPSLTVIGRTSSFQFKGKNEDLRIIGRKLGAAYVLEGSVRKSGDRIRVTAQLINAQTGAHEWSESYDRPFSDVLKMQDEIAAALVRTLQLTLDANTLQPRGSLGNTDSYNLYLQGLYAFNQYDRDGFEAAIRYFRQALELDPTSAAAAASLARTYAVKGDFGYSASRDTWELARKAAETALKLDPKSTAAHTTLAMIHCFYDWDWSAAETELKQATALSPRDSWTLLIESILSSTLGKWDEAFAQLNGSLAIDPLDPGAWQNMAYLQLRREHLPEAEAAARRTLEIAPTFDGVHLVLGLILLAREDRTAALAAMQQESSDDRDLWLSVVYHAMNRKVESDAALATYTREHSSDDPFGLADAHAFRGEADAAFSWLDRAYFQKESGLYWIKGDTLLKKLEGDPRYKAFLRRMSLPE